MTNNRFVFLACFLSSICSGEFPRDSHAAEKPLARIVFGSCAHQDHDQPIWDTIVAAKPDLFLMIGDNIYGDSRDARVLKAKYEKLGARPGFKKLRATCPLLATWDDHDYGENDAGVEYPSKVASQKVFNDFFNVPEESPRRQREGIYDAQTFGPQGKRVQIILLDTRYFRSPLRSWGPKERPKGSGPYRPHEESNEVVTVLGEAQWKWLGQQLRQPAEVRIIATSIQAIANENGWETWGNFPRDRQRLFDLISETKAGGVVFISGDRHLAEISRIDAEDSGASYALYDVTSSSLNRPGSGANDNEPNGYRLGKNYSPINFGEIAIDWEQKDAAITLSIHGGDGEVVREQKLSLRDLQANSD